LTIGFLSMVTAWVNDPSGLRRPLQTFVGVSGGIVGLTLGAIALFRLLTRQNALPSNVIAASAAIGCSAVAALLGLHLLAG
jgi:hypothetical protein